MPFNCSVRKRGYCFGDTAHGGGCPIEQVGEETVDGVAPEECPPKDSTPHEEIDKEGEGEIADDGESGETAKVVGGEWRGKEGADTCDGNDLENLRRFGVDEALA